MTLPMLSDQLRTIAARLCKTDDTAIDGRMLLEAADRAAIMESELATLREVQGDFLMAANDLTNALANVSAKLPEPNRR